MSFTLQDALGLAALLGIGLAILVVVVSAYIAWRLTHPARRTAGNAIARSLPTDPSELDEPLEYEAWSLRSAGRDLPAWTIQGRAPEGPTAILAHGWGDGRLGALVRVPALASHCRGVIVIDLPGQGEAPGSCALGTREHHDLLAAAERVEGPVLLYGWSLGGGSVLRAAAEDTTGRIVAVIAEAPYRFPKTPARNVLRLAGLPHHISLPIAFGMLRAILGRELHPARFDRAAWAAKIHEPVLVLHGHDDEVCPIDDGRTIANAGAKLAEIEHGRHNDLWTDPDRRAACTAAVDDFLRSLAASR